MIATTEECKQGTLHIKLLEDILQFSSHFGELLLLHIDKFVVLTDNAQQFQL